jgi:hypothetical protein
MGCYAGMALRGVWFGLSKFEEPLFAYWDIRKWLYLSKNSH